MYDFLIIGQGLAGTSLAWNLLQEGAKVMVVDRGDEQSSSRIAAGLITPVSGQRLTCEPHFHQLQNIAQQHYSLVDRLTPEFQGWQTYTRQSALRFCLTDAELHSLNSRRHILGNAIAPLTRPVPNGFAPTKAIFELPDAAQVNVLRYLNRSRDYFENQQAYLSASVALSNIQCQRDQVILGDHNLAARRIVFCGGYADADNHWLPQKSFEPAKGEVLTVRIDGLCERRVIHAANLWLYPLDEPFHYQCGATFDRENLQPHTTRSARELLLTRLNSFVTGPIKVLHQQAAVRPIGRHRLAVIGQHAEHSIAWFNGLGSKGALWAPALARRISAELIKNKPINGLTLSDAISPIDSKLDGQYFQ